MELTKKQIKDQFNANAAQYDPQRRVSLFLVLMTFTPSLSPCLNPKMRLLPF